MGVARGIGVSKAVGGSRRWSLLLFSWNYIILHTVHSYLLPLPLSIPSTNSLPKKIDDIKLFDFGMARELRPELKVDDENYRLSKCGSPTYMAPGTSRLYCLSALFWMMRLDP